jgi:hypothetical protein
LSKYVETPVVELVETTCFQGWEFPGKREHRHAVGATTPPVIRFTGFFFVCLQEQFKIL